MRITEDPHNVVDRHLRVASASQKRYDNALGNLMLNLRIHGRIERALARGDVTMDMVKVRRVTIPSLLPKKEYGRHYIRIYMWSRVV